MRDKFFAKVAHLNDGVRAGLAGQTIPSSSAATYRNTTNKCIREPEIEKVYKDNIARVHRSVSSYLRRKIDLDLRRKAVELNVKFWSWSAKRAKTFEHLDTGRQRVD